MDGYKQGELSVFFFSVFLLHVDKSGRTKLWTIISNLID